MSHDPPTDALPCATDFPGVGGVIRQRDEDFFVQELPAYEASGEGPHILAEVQKVGLTTHEMVRRLARALDVRPVDVGYAGLKDRHAITRQIVSVPDRDAAGGPIDEERVMRLEVEGVAPLWAARHGNKLKVGHLAGNRFAIKIRDVLPTDVVKLRPVLNVLSRRGLPNYYGEQRFGTDADRPNDALGLALVAGEAERFLRLFLGGADRREDVAAARRLVDAGDLGGALAAWPGNLALERRVLEAWAGRGPGRALAALDRKARQFYVSAAQSAVFNRVTAARVRDGSYATVLAGDIAIKHENGAKFAVEDAAAEAPRAEAFEISATGPMPGAKMRRPLGVPAEIEAAALAELGIPADAFAGRDATGAHGERRALRVRPADTSLAAGIDDHGPHITIAFTLPPGSFATVLLRELMGPRG